MMRIRRGAQLLDSLGSVTVGGVGLINPFMTASGTAGHDVELAPYMPLHKIGATTVKSLFHTEWEGNPAPRVHTASSGMMNAVGLQGPGVSAWIEESLPKLRTAGVVVIASIWGRTLSEYVSAATQLRAAGEDIAAIEVNLSCPNLEGRTGIIAHDDVLSAQIIAAVRAESTVPVWAKLSANTDRIVEIAQSVVEAGAQSLTVINTMVGLQIDVATGRPTLGNGGGGLSGPAIHPIAVRAVFDIRRAIPQIDIVGVGGIRSGSDALEMMLAGANAIQVGTASFADPAATWRIAREAAVLAHRRGASTWSDVVSVAHTL
jgi:dihydroorotate dehydrogenase (NAD+) catalytic subunit